MPTSNLSGDTRIWIEDDNSFPGVIRAWNDDYYSSDPHDFSWGAASRIKKDFSVRIKSVLISAYSSYAPLGTCDLYIKVNPLSTETYYTGIWPFRTEHTRTPILEAFPNLKANDAMQTAWEGKDNYQCISWSGGITSYKEWPLSLSSNYCELAYDSYYGYYCKGPESFDNFYESPNRYAGCMAYTNSGANSSNSVVDLWYNPNYYDYGYGDYTHGSVRKPGNNHPHGYDWESKPGTMERIFSSSKCFK